MAFNVRKKETSSPAATAASAAFRFFFLPIFETEKAIVEMTLKTTTISTTLI